MVVDDRSSQELYRRLEEVLGPQAATTLIERLPRVGWADVATRHDLAGLEQRVDLRFERVDERFNRVDEQFNRVDERFNRVDVSIKAAASDLRATFEHELRSVSSGFEHELRAVSSGLEHELRAVSSGLERELRSQITTMVLGLVGIVLTMAALAFALVRFS